MKKVGNPSQTLLTPSSLRKALVEVGEKKHFSPQSVLFQTGDKNAGVFLVCAGQVRLEVPGVPQLGRAFSAGSVLGLPSTFSEKPYALTAVSATDSDIMHVSQKSFLDLMNAQPELCRQATDILSREVTFIMSALRQRAQAVSKVEITTAGAYRRVVNG